MFQKDEEHERIQKRMLYQMRNLKIEIEQLKKEKSNLEEKMKMVEWIKNFDDNKKDGNKTKDQLKMKPTTCDICTVTFDNIATNKTSCDKKVPESQEKLQTREWKQFNPGQNTKRIETNVAVTMDVPRTSPTRKQINISVSYLYSFNSVAHLLILKSP